MNRELEAKIICALREHFPNLPVQVEESPEDDLILCVSVFSVPDHMSRIVKKFIHALSRNELAGYDVILLPMVFDIQTTNEHYSQYLSIAGVNKESCEAFLFKAIRCEGDMPIWAAVDRCLPAMTAANTEYALAA